MAKKLLESLKGKSLFPEDLTNLIDQLIFRVRSSLRELVTAGWVQESEGRYVLTEQETRLTSNTNK